MPAKATITASLSPELTDFIAAKVAGGRYRSASEVVRAAFRPLVEQDTRRQPRRVKQNSAGRDAR